MPSSSTQVHPPFDIATTIRIGLLIFKLDANFEPGTKIFFSEFVESLN